jgi:4-amino-4-deoxy-L-arabinose transferase-like glycosyltransferase
MLTPPRDTASTSNGIAAAPERGFSITSALLVSLGIYFGLHVVTRWLVSHNLQLDEAEQLIVTQDWRLGYGSQPPLYNWMQKALFDVFGVNVFALSLLKNFSLWAAYAFTFLAAREILASARLAALATAGLLFFPQIAWESQRDQSHLVLATTFAAVTLWIYVRLLKTEQLRWFFLFGMAAALGFLAKYNYMLLPAALICASLIMPPYRRAIINWKTLVALAAFVALAAPHLVWMAENKAEVSSQSYKFVATGRYVGNLPFAAGLQFLITFLGMAIVPLVIFAPLITRTLRTKTSQSAPLVSLVGKSLVAGIVLTLLVVIAFRVTFLRDRWVQPLMFMLPIYLVGYVGQQLEDKHFKRMFGLAVIVAITVLTVMNVTVIGANVLKRSHNLNIPYPALAAELRKTGFERGAIVANGFLLGGNIKSQFRNCRVIVPELEEKEAPARPTLLIWSARTSDVPADFIAYASRVIGAKSEMVPTYLDIPCQNGKRTSEKFGFVLLP